MRPVQRIDVTPAAGVNCTPLAPSSPALADFAIHASATAASRARVAALLALIMLSPGGRVSRILVPALLRRVLLSHRTPLRAASQPHPRSAWPDPHETALALAAPPTGHAPRQAYRG